MLPLGRAIARLALDAVAAGVALSSTRIALIGDRNGNLTCLELVTP
jgi:sulfur relay (sulfurtransferase) DsrF/TusC family protein